MNAEQHVPDKRQRELLDKHLELVIEENKVTNLTRIVDWESAQILHVEDSLAGLPEVQEAMEGPYLDMGSGAGFPGIPLAIMTGRETLLADSVGKKTRALDSFAVELGIDDIVSTYHGRIEDLALQQPNRFSLITARALSSLASLLEHAQAVARKLGMEFVSSRGFTLSDGETSRAIIVFKKRCNPSMRLPRRVGMAQKKPF